VEACSINGIRIYLPNSGWLGWLAMGWGGWGFSAGMAGTSWVDRIPTPMTKPEIPSLPYFERQLMRAVPWRVHEQLVHEAGYQQCGCADCKAMGGEHDLLAAKRHQLRYANASAASMAPLGASERRALAATQLDGALQFAETLSAPVAARVDIGFLERWRELL
jgi:hypothetical protein